MAGLVVYTAGCALAMVAESFTLLLAARMIQGFGAAAARVLSVAIVRDRFEGRDMARVMSFCMMVFLIIPVIAPSIGSVILLVGEWHMIFGAMMTLGLVLALWFGLRMPETLPLPGGCPSRRAPSLPAWGASSAIAAPSSTPRPWA